MARQLADMDHAIIIVPLLLFLGLKKTVAKRSPSGRRSKVYHAYTYTNGSGGSSRMRSPLINGAALLVGIIAVSAVTVLCVSRWNSQPAVVAQTAITSWVHADRATLANAASGGAHGGGPAGGVAWTHSVPLIVFYGGGTGLTTLIPLMEAHPQIVVEHVEPVGAGGPLSLAASTRTGLDTLERMLREWDADERRLQECCAGKGATNTAECTGSVRVIALPFRTVADAFPSTSGASTSIRSGSNGGGAGRSASSSVSGAASLATGAKHPVAPAAQAVEDYRERLRSLVQRYSARALFLSRSDHLAWALASLAARTNPGAPCATDFLITGRQSSGEGGGCFDPAEPGSVAVTYGRTRETLSCLAHCDAWPMVGGGCGGDHKRAGGGRTPPPRSPGVMWVNFEDVADDSDAVMSQVFAFVGVKVASEAASGASTTTSAASRRVTAAWKAPSASAATSFPIYRPPFSCKRRFNVPNQSTTSTSGGASAGTTSGSGSSPVASGGSVSNSGVGASATGIQPPSPLQLVGTTTQPKYAPLSLPDAVEGIEYLREYYRGTCYDDDLAVSGPRDSLGAGRQPQYLPPSPLGSTATVGRSAISAAAAAAAAATGLASGLGFGSSAKNALPSVAACAGQSPLRTPPLFRDTGSSTASSGAGNGLGLATPGTSSSALSTSSSSSSSSYGQTRMPCSTRLGAGTFTGTLPLISQNCALGATVQAGLRSAQAMSARVGADQPAISPVFATGEAPWEVLRPGGSIYAGAGSAAANGGLGLGVASVSQPPLVPPPTIVHLAFEGVGRKLMKDVFSRFASAMSPLSSSPSSSSSSATSQAADSGRDGLVPGGSAGGGKELPQHAWAYQQGLRNGFAKGGALAFDIPNGMPSSLDGLVGEYRAVMLLRDVRDVAVASYYFMRSSNDSFLYLPMPRNSGLSWKEMVSLPIKSHLPQ
eukprot:jgi/Mesvir1/22450/Mv17918-RA.1